MEMSEGPPEEEEIIREYNEEGTLTHYKSSFIEIFYDNQGNEIKFIDKEGNEHIIQLEKGGPDINKMPFEDIEPNIWKYEKAGDSVEGKLVSVQEKVGPNDSMMYSIETKEGILNVWGSAILDSKMILLKVGDIIRITYQGKGEAKGGKNAPKLFKVERDTGGK